MTRAPDRHRTAHLFVRLIPYPIKINIPWHQNPNANDYNTILFKLFFPSLEGMAARADKILHDARSGYYHTAKANKIRFHDPSAKDPDVKVRKHMVQRPLIVRFSLLLFPDKALLYPTR